MVDSNSTIENIGDDHLQDDDTKSHTSQVSELWETSGVGMSALCLNVLQDISDAASQYSSGSRTLSRKKKESPKKSFADFFKRKSKSKSKKSPEPTSSADGTLDRKKSQNGQSAPVPLTVGGSSQKEKATQNTDAAVGRNGQKGRGTKHSEKEKDLKLNSIVDERNFDVSGKNRSTTLPRNRADDDAFSKREKGKTLSSADGAKSKKFSKSKRNTEAAVEQKEPRSSRLVGPFKRLEKLITNSNQKVPTAEDLAAERDRKEDVVEVPTDKIGLDEEDSSKKPAVNEDGNSENNYQNLGEVQKSVFDAEQRPLSAMKNMSDDVPSQESPRTVPRGRARERDSDRALRRGRSAETLPTKGQTKKIRRRALSREWVVLKTTTTEYTTTFAPGSKKGEQWQMFPPEKAALIPQSGSKTDLTSPETSREKDWKTSVPEKIQVAEQNPHLRRDFGEVVFNDMNNNDFSEMQPNDVRQASASFSSPQARTDIEKKAEQTIWPLIPQQQIQSKKLTDSIPSLTKEGDSFHVPSSSEQKNSTSPHQVKSVGSIQNVPGEELIEKLLPQAATNSFGDDDSNKDSSCPNYSEAPKAFNSNPSLTAAEEASPFTDPRLTEAESYFHQEVFDGKSSEAIRRPEIDDRIGLEGLSWPENNSVYHGRADEDENVSAPRGLKSIGNDEYTASGSNKARWTKRKSAVRSRTERSPPDDRNSAEAQDLTRLPHHLNDRDWPEDPISLQLKTTKNGNSSPRLTKPRWTKRKAMARGSRQSAVPALNSDQDAAQQIQSGDNYEPLASRDSWGSGGMANENIDFLAANDSSENKPRWTKRQPAARGKSRALVGVNSTTIQTHCEISDAPAPASRPTTIGRTPRSPRNMRGTHANDDAVSLDSGYSTLNLESSKVYGKGNISSRADERPIISVPLTRRYVRFSPGTSALARPDAAKTATGRNDQFDREDNDLNCDRLVAKLLDGEDASSLLESVDIHDDDIIDDWSECSLTDDHQPPTAEPSAAAGDGCGDALFWNTPVDDESSESEVHFCGSEPYDVDQDPVDFDVTPTNNESLLYWNDDGSSDSDTISDRNEKGSHDELIENDESSNIDDYSQDGNDAAYFADIDANDWSAYREGTDASDPVQAKHIPKCLSSTGPESAHSNAGTRAASQLYDRDCAQSESARSGLECLRDAHQLNAVLGSDTTLLENFDRRKVANIDEESTLVNSKKGSPLSSVDAEGHMSGAVQYFTGDREPATDVKTSPSLRDAEKAFGIPADSSKTHIERSEQDKDPATLVAEHLPPYHEDNNSDGPTPVSQSSVVLSSGQTSMETNDSLATNLIEISTKCSNEEENESHSSGFSEVHSGHRKEPELEENLSYLSSNTAPHQKEGITGVNELTTSIADRTRMPGQESPRTEHEQKADSCVNSEKTTTESDDETLSQSIDLAPDSSRNSLPGDSKSVEDRPAPSFRGATGRRFPPDDDRCSPMFLPRRLHVDVPYSDSGYSETEVETLSPCSFRSSISRADTVTEEGQSESLTDDDSRFDFALTDENVAPDEKRSFVNIPGLSVKSGPWAKDATDHSPADLHLSGRAQMTLAKDTPESSSHATAGAAVFDTVSPGSKNEQTVSTVLPQQQNEFEIGSQSDDGKYSLESYVSRDSGLGSSAVRSDVFEFPETTEIDGKTSDMISSCASTKERQTESEQNETMAEKQIQEFIKDSEHDKEFSNLALSKVEERRLPNIDTISESETANCVIPVAAKSADLSEPRSALKEKENDIFSKPYDHEIAFTKMNLGISEHQTTSSAGEFVDDPESLFEEGTASKEIDGENLNGTYQPEFAEKDGFPSHQVPDIDASSNRNTPLEDASTVDTKESEMFDGLCQQKDALKSKGLAINQIQTVCNDAEVSSKSENLLEDGSSIIEKDSEASNRLCKSDVKEIDSEHFNRSCQRVIEQKDAGFPSNQVSTIDASSKRNRPSPLEDASAVETKDGEMFDVLCQQKDAIRSKCLTINQNQIVCNFTEVSRKSGNLLGGGSPIKEKGSEASSKLYKSAAEEIDGENCNSRPTYKQETVQKDADFPSSHVPAIDASSNHNNPLEDASAVETKESEIFDGLGQQKDALKSKGLAINQSQIVCNVTDTEVSSKSKNLLEDRSSMMEKGSEASNGLHRPEGTFLRQDLPLNSQGMKVACVMDNGCKGPKQLKVNELVSIKSDEASKDLTSSGSPGISAALLQAENIAESKKPAAVVLSADLLKKEQIADSDTPVDSGTNFKSSNICSRSVIYPSFTERNSTVECQVLAKEKNASKVVDDLTFKPVAVATELENDREVLTWYEYAELFSIYRQFSDGNDKDESLWPSAWIWNGSRYTASNRSNSDRGKGVHLLEPRPCRSFSWSLPSTRFDLVRDRDLRPRHRSTSSLEQQTRGAMERCPSDPENSDHKEQSALVSKSVEINDASTTFTTRNAIEHQNNAQGDGFRSANSSGSGKNVRKQQFSESKNQEKCRGRESGPTDINHSSIVKNCSKKSIDDEDGTYLKNLASGNNCLETFPLSVDSNTRNVSTETVRNQDKMSTTDLSKNVSEFVDSICTSSQRIAAVEHENDNVCLLDAGCEESVNSFVDRNHSSSQMNAPDVVKNDQCLQRLASTLDSSSAPCLVAEDLSRRKDDRQGSETIHESSQTEPSPFANCDTGAVACENGEDSPDSQLRQRSRLHPGTQDEATSDNDKPDSDDTSSASRQPNRSNSTLVGFLASTAGLLSIIFLIYISIRNSGNVEINTKNNS